MVKFCKRCNIDIDGLGFIVRPASWHNYAFKIYFKIYSGRINQKNPLCRECAEYHLNRMNSQVVIEIPVHTELRSTQ